MKTRKSPTQENVGAATYSETARSKESELNDRSEERILNGSIEAINGETMIHQGKSNGDMKIDESIFPKNQTVKTEHVSSTYKANALQENKHLRDLGEDFEVSISMDNDMEKVRKVSSRDEIRETRKRKAKQDVSQEIIDNNRWLCAINQTGREIKVKILISNRPYYRDRSSSMNLTTDGGKDLGNDGNQHYCQVCRGFGDVVCCDGCPRVYHHKCIPLHSTSRLSLDNDDDPWYCPKCVEKKNKNSSKKEMKKANGMDKRERNSAQRRCVNCEQTLIDRKLLPCVVCGVYMHFPSCTYSNGAPRDELLVSTKPICRNCKVIDHDEGMDTDASGNYENKNGKTKGTQYFHSDVDDSGVDDEENGAQYAAVKEKKAKNARVTLMAPSIKKSFESDKKLKKKKKNRKRALSTADDMETEEDEAARRQSIKDDPILQPRGSSTGVQAIPAFCFYLAENRWKIERSLSRKHRTFLRLPKGDERNALVAQEAAIWWTKLEPHEHKLYINMSIRDFESRVIIWKEEKLGRESPIENNGIVGGISDDGALADVAATTMDYQNRVEMYERLYLSTAVGSKLFKLEVDHNYNRVLLDLLHDHRFHPVPMLNINRSDIDGLLSEENTNVTMPFFEVQGPVSTSIGDECLGCSRGWAHFCSVLQCRVPTVEYRARLQPPLSSLLATRIGLGLRPRNEEEVNINVPSTNENSTMFKWRESDETNETKGLFNIPTCHVFDPKDRADDMVLFIEETAAMKLPEPPRPINPESNQKKSALRVLPTQRQREGQVEGDGDVCESVMHNKCGRCRTMITNNAGCVPCRRAQLVINKSKVAPFSSQKNGEGKSLKVHTIMLGKIHAKDGTGEAQSASDQRVSEAMLKVRWCPTAILPPSKLYVPTPKVVDSRNDCEDGSSECDDGESNNQEEFGDAEENLTVNEPSLTEATALLELAGLSVPSTKEDLTNDELPTKRVRSARSMSMVDKETIVTEPDRPQLKKHYKKETTEIQKKVTRIACLSILHAVMRRDPLRIFEEFVNLDGNQVLVQTDMDLKKVRRQLLSGYYESLSSFIADIRSICDTAMVNHPPITIYHKTAQDILDALVVMQFRANSWMSTIKAEQIKILQHREIDRPDEVIDDETIEDPFAELRKVKPQLVEMLDKEEKLLVLVGSDFRRTLENETSFYGCLAIRRAAAAAEASLAQYPDTSDQHTVIPLRKHYEDEDLRDHINKKVSEVEFPQLKNVSSWREELTLRLIRKVQKLRLERLQNVDSACSRLTPLDSSCPRPSTYKAEILLKAKTKKKSEHNDAPRVSNTRGLLATGLASAKTCQRILQRSKSHRESDYSAYNSVNDVCVSVRGSKIHGMGLFADQPFAKGEVVAEYVGEYIVSPIAELREKYIEDQRIQDYQFRLDDTYVIDATTKGSWARYINHSCTPNCKSMIIPGDELNLHSRRVLIVAKRSIEFNEELTYDYQFPLALDLNARIPCNCQSENCRGFMNWDLPEKGSNNRALLVHKRGANMRDRIRRLGRPLKKDEM